jgi:hypothetical protein
MTAARILVLCGLAAAVAEASFSMEAAHATGTERMHAKLKALERRHKASLKRIMAGMTTTTALDKLRKHQNETVMQLVQTAMAGNQGGEGNLRASVSQPDSGYSGVAKAKDMLNEMIQETQAKYDLEIQTCCDYDKTQSGLIEQARQDISNFNAEAAEARKEVLDAQDHIEVCEKKLPELKDALVIHNRECAMETKSLEEQLKIIDEDLNVMSMILGMINCEKKSSAALLAFSGCVDGCGESFVAFHHDKLHSAIAGLKHDATRQLLNAQFFDDSEGSQDSQDADFFEDQGTSESEDGAKELNLAANKQTPTLDAKLPDLTATTTTTWGPPALDTRNLKRSGPCKTPVPEDKRTGKCSIDSNPNCEAMQEKFVVIQSGIQDKRDEIQKQLDDLTESCKITRTNLEAQIADFETQLQDQLTALAAATKKQNTAEEQSRLKSIELKGFMADYDAMTTRCHGNYETLEGDECGLKKIRGELYKMKGQDHPAFFQDCVVSDWIAGDCSVSCGGGQLKMSRTIVTGPVGGAACPVMEELKSCNEDKCPIDCAVGDWSGWSACTAKCGGGLQERARDKLVEPAHGGVPCEETTEAKSCNLQSCDKDCELTDWTAWTDCSKACDGGSSSRKKTILVGLMGAGTCPAIRDPERMQSQSCNVMPCKNALLTFKYFKFTPDKLRDNGRANSVQVGEMNFQNDNGMISKQGWKAENPGGRSPGGEAPEKGIDDNTGTKWLDFNKKSLEMEAVPPVEVSDFQFVTANDATERDPVKWTLYGSEDKRKWQVLVKSTYTSDTPSSRYAGTKWFPVPKQPLRCASTVDVVLVLDGSGSLRQAGWDATVKAAEMIVNSFMAGGKVQMAILLFSRKSTWVQHFDGDKEKTLENIKKLKWPRGGTKTSEALNTAAAELNLGRGSAQSIVMVITDGKPQSPTKTKKAAEKLRDSARLMWVPVTKYAPLADIQEMASYPKDDNIMVVKNFADLEKSDTIDRVVADICPLLY